MRYRHTVTGAVISVPDKGALVAAAVTGDPNWQPVDSSEVVTNAESGNTGRRKGRPAAGTDRSRSGVDRTATGRGVRPRRRVSASDGSSGADAGGDQPGGGGNGGDGTDPPVNNPA